jgi:hypothetical protein
MPENYYLTVYLPSAIGIYHLRQRLANDEVLAVAYQYTVGDQVIK